MKKRVGEKELRKTGEEIGSEGGERGRARERG